MLYLDHLLQLADHQETPAVSLFIPTHTALSNAQNKKCLEKALAQAQTCLLEHLSESEIESFIAPIQQLLSDDDFWQNLKMGLAIYRGPDFFKWVHTPYRLPYGVVVNSHFHLLPLIPYLEQSQRMFVLDLTVKTPVLYEANAFEIEEAEVPHAIPSLEKKRDFQKITPMLAPFLQKQNLPLIIAGTHEDYQAFTQQCHYPQHAHLLFSTPQGGWKNTQLAIHTALQGQLQQLLEHIRQYAINELKQQQNTSSTLSNMREVANAAYNSRIASLFVQPSPETSETVLTEDNLAMAQELVNLATTHTVLNGGKIYTLPQDAFPAQMPVAAILRY